MYLVEFKHTLCTGRRWYSLSRQGLFVTNIKKMPKLEVQYLRTNVRKYVIFVLKYPLDLRGR